MAPSALLAILQSKTRNKQSSLAINQDHARHIADVCACIRLLPLTSVNTITRHNLLF